MEIEFEFECPHEAFIDTFEDAVDSLIKESHELYRTSRHWSNPIKIDYKFISESPDAFYKLGCIITSVYEGMKKEYPLFFN